MTKELTSDKLCLKKHMSQHTQHLYSTGTILSSHCVATHSATHCIAQTFLICRYTPLKATHMEMKYCATQTATHCNTHNSHCNALQHTATHCNTHMYLPADIHVEIHCNTNCNTLQHKRPHTQQRTATHIHFYLPI